ncbi:MAG: hypothetical protein COB81_11510 [Flavobacteriaceae bacterium]|nr:MAG: hypothetical protein COB81_11510 [Flavobacteriaceae bacterium]
MKKYKNKYRIPSARHPDWDYGANADYFVTICTHNHQHFFGKISNGIMILSNIGEIVRFEWVKSFEMRPDMNLTMFEYVVMPNHFHAIIGIGKNKYNDGMGRDAMPCVSIPANMDFDNVKGDGNVNGKGDAMPCVSTFGPQSKNLASIIRGFKTGVTQNAQQKNANFKWQGRFYDHIIKNEKSFQNISNYIINNPRKWADDKFHGINNI